MNSKAIIFLQTCFSPAHHVVQISFITGSLHDCCLLFLLLLGKKTAGGVIIRKSGLPYVPKIADDIVPGSLEASQCANNMSLTRCCCGDPNVR